ncbi:MAG: class I SAM-dependent methyltransferase [Deltaproteobacteria bacterium]
MTVEHISDTARWVAVYRAMETERPDAHFRDPYARRLAGPKGEAIVRSIRGGRSMSWAMVVRTVAFDEMMLRAVSRGADLVLNLAAGLDTRPYRLDLPRALRWVEVDLPGITDYKEEQLRGEVPRCALERVRLDLTDLAARRALFTRLGGEARQVAVLTEGLLAYLQPEQVASLAADLHTPPTFARWMTELASPWILKRMKRKYKKITGNAGTAPMHFGPAQGSAFFQPYGWKVAEERSGLEEARRLRREMPLAWLMRLTWITAKQRETARRITQFIELVRT